MLQYVPTQTSWETCSRKSIFESDTISSPMVISVNLGSGDLGTFTDGAFSIFWLEEG